MFEYIPFDYRTMTYSQKFILMVNGPFKQSAPVQAPVYNGALLNSGRNEIIINTPTIITIFFILLDCVTCFYNMLY